MKSLSSHLPSGDGFDTVVFHFGTLAGTVEQTCEVFLKTYLFKENGIPDRKIDMRIAVEIFKPEFFNDTCFHTSGGAADPHTDLA